VIRLLATVLLAALLTACGRQAPDPARHPAPSPGAQAVASNPALDATARAFVELVIATDDQAVALLDLGAERAADPALRAFAGEQAAARRAELTRLHEILDAAGIPYANQHAGHDMPGMPTEAELAALGTAADFDAEFTRLARAHLTESATVARSGAGSITHERTKAVADAMVRERADALAALDALPR
jgi:uncharacterized protein (DUF305 family)